MSNTKANTKKILNRANAVAGGLAGMMFRPAQSNGQRLNNQKVVKAINSATGNVRVVRNMMPRLKTFTKKVELPLYMYVNTSGALKLYKGIDKTNEITLPLTGLEFTESEEYQDLSCEIDTMRLQAIGASVNFINTDTNLVGMNIFEKWMYGNAPEKSKAKYDSTWQPLEWEKKSVQNYKTFLPRTTEGYMTFYSPVAFTDTLRNLHYDMTMEVPDSPATATIIGTISLALWIQCKRKNIIDFSHEFQTRIEEKDKELDNKDKEIEKLKNTIKSIMVGNQ